MEIREVDGSRLSARFDSLQKASYNLALDSDAPKSARQRRVRNVEFHIPDP